MANCYTFPVERAVTPGRRCEVERAVEFPSEGAILRGLLRLPDDRRSGEDRVPVIVHGPGWLGLADAAHYRRFHEAFVVRGFAVLAFDHRGHVPGGKRPGWIDPEEQIRDTQAAVRFAAAHARLDPDRIGLYGVGATGAGNAIVVAARDERIRCVVAYHAIADGEDWLRRMRTPDEWSAFRARVAADRERRLRGLVGETVDPREEIMVQSAERRASGSKRDVDARLPERFLLASADALLAYRPIDEAHRASAVLVAVVAGDDVTPEEHGVALYERARRPKRLVRLRGVGHYEANGRCFRALADEFVGWFERWLGPTRPERSDLAEVAEIDAVGAPA